VQHLWERDPQRLRLLDEWRHDQHRDADQRTDQGQVDDEDRGPPRQALTPAAAALDLRHERRQTNRDERRDVDQEQRPADQKQHPRHGHGQCQADERVANQGAWVVFYGHDKSQRHTGTEKNVQELCVYVVRDR
jgi:hypothetical protein